MLTRPIPSSGEALPVIGLGTWQTFDVGGAAASAPPWAGAPEVLRPGARLIDSSPMYGRSEAVVGDLLKQSARRRRSSGHQGLDARQGRRRRSDAAVAAAAGHGRMDLMQVHNLLDVETHLPVLRD